MSLFLITYESKFWNTETRIMVISAESLEEAEEKFRLQYPSLIQIEIEPEEDDDE